MTGKIVMAGYVRVSTREQAERRNGLEAQEASLRAEAERQGWELRVYRDEGASGKDVNPCLRDALHDLAAGRLNGLVVSKLDRLARSTIHASDIMQRARSQGWTLVMLDVQVDTSKATGSLIANVIAAIAEFERELISERTKDALGAKRARGEQLGRKPKSEAWLVDRIAREREAGDSFTTIADRLTDDQILSPGGRNVWQPSTVRRTSAATLRRAEAQEVA
jgi:DNA invertase Pin-like site-specific DNA recombinase